MDQNTNDLPKIPEPPEESNQAGDIESVKFIEETWFSRYKYILICLIVFVLIVIFQTQKYSKMGAKDIIVLENSVSLTLNDQFIKNETEIKAELVKKKTISFLVNNAWIDKNTGTLAAIPMIKVKELEKKYTSDFTRCGSAGEQEGKNSMVSIGLIANNPLVKISLNKIADLAAKGSLTIIEIDGSQLKNIENTNVKDDKDRMGLAVINASTYYLVDSLIIVKEGYAE